MDGLGRVLVGALLVTACQPQGRRGEAGGAVVADQECLDLLRRSGVPARSVEPVQGVRTPVEVTGPIAGIALAPRAGREAVMDCALARGLYEAAPVFRSLGLETLEFSGAYDFRTRRGSDVLSAHAHGLAIDVHVLGGPAGRLDVARDFERGVGEWKQLRPGPGRLAACIGQPRTEAGTTLRKLVCRLKLHTAFRVIVTPDDNDDHRDHLHLEVYADAEGPGGDAGAAPSP